MTLAHRAVRAIKRFLFRNAPEFAVLDVTRDEAYFCTSETGGPITPADISSIWLAKGEGAMRPKLKVTAWLIANYETMRDGNWPDVRPEEIPTHGGYWRHGPQEMPGMYAAEVWSRIQQCGEDGFLCWLYYQGEKVALTPDVCRRINRALRYCSGWARRRVPYKLWCQHRRTFSIDMRKV